MSRILAARMTKIPGLGLWASLLGVLLVLALLVLDGAPAVRDSGPPDATAVEQALAVARRLKLFADSDGAEGSWSISEREMNAVLAAAQRVAPGVIARARIEPDALSVDVAAGQPLLPRGLWVNLHVAFAPSEDGLQIASARIGRLPLPPGLAFYALRRSLERAMGDGLGTAAVESIAALRLDPERATLVLRFDEQGRSAFFARLRERAYSGAGVAARQAVYRQLKFIDKAVGRGRLPRRGSVLPYLTYAVKRADNGAEPGPETLRGALYALALYCGDPVFGGAVGVTLAADYRGGRNGCDGTRLADRDDLKRHFVISAGLYAATTSGKAAFGVGELKELLDSVEPEGFSFDDMAADAAGVRFAAAFLSAGPRERRRMLERIGSEADLMPSLDGLPGGLSEAEFRSRFGDVDSPEYAAMVAEIDRRVNALPLYAPGIN